MKKIVLLLAIVLLAVSCRESQSEFEVKEVDFVNKSDVTVKGTPVDVEFPLDLRDIAVCDSYRILLCNDGEARMSVYSADWDFLGRFCFIGRARNEFINQPSMVSGQILRTDGRILIPLSDGLQDVKVMDLQQSLDAGRTIMWGKTDYRPFKEMVIKEEYGTMTLRNDINFVFIDNDINHQFEWCRPMMMGGIHVDPYFAVMNDTAVISKIDLHNYFDDEQFKFIGGKLFKHPSRNLVILPMEIIDYILFIDLDKDLMWAVHQQGSLSLFDQLPPVNFSITHFGRSAVCTESCFMILYFGGDPNAEDIYRENAFPELLTFDWEGNFLKSVKLDTHVNRIAYDEKTQTLYGVDRYNDRIVSFDLK
jgi:hypothetical protein